jgi:hypothetical protein
MRILIIPTKRNNMPTDNDIFHMWKQRRQQVNQGFLHGMELLEQDKTTEAMPFITNAADKNLPAAQYQLGRLSEATSLIKAFKLYLQAADNKHPQAIEACADLILMNKVKSESYSSQQLENLIISLDDTSPMKKPLKRVLQRNNKSGNRLKPPYRINTVTKNKHVEPPSIAMKCQQLIDSGYALEKVSRFLAAKSQYLQSLTLAEQREDRLRALLQINHMLINRRINYPDLSLTTLMQIITLYKTEFIFMGSVNETVCNTTLLDSIIKKIKKLKSYQNRLKAFKQLHALFTQDKWPRYTDQTKTYCKLESTRAQINASCHKT